MLTLLRERAHGERLDIETRVMDGHALELDDASFDVAGSQFGVMLFPDMPAGEMVRVVRPGGRVLMTVYGDPRQIEFFGFFLRAIQSVRADFTGPPMEPPPLPFQLQSPRRLESELVAAPRRPGRDDYRNARIRDRLGAVGVARLEQPHSRADPLGDRPDPCRAHSGPAGAGRFRRRTRSRKRIRLPDEADQHRRGAK